MQVREAESMPGSACVAFFVLAGARRRDERTAMPGRDSVNRARSGRPGELVAFGQASAEAVDGRSGGGGPELDPRPTPGAERGIHRPRPNAPADDPEGRAHP